MKSFSRKTLKTRIIEQRKIQKFSLPNEGEISTLPKYSFSFKGCGSRQWQMEEISKQAMVNYKNCLDMI